VGTRLEGTWLIELDTSQCKLIIHVQLNNCAIIEREAVRSIDYD